MKAYFEKTRLLLFVLVGIISISFFTNCGGEDPQDSPDATTSDISIPPTDDVVVNNDVDIGGTTTECEDDQIWISELEGCYEAPEYDLTGTWSDVWETMVSNVTQENYVARGFVLSNTIYVFGSSLFYEYDGDVINGEITENGSQVDIDAYSSISGNTEHFTFFKQGDGNN